MIELHAELIAAGAADHAAGIRTGPDASTISTAGITGSAVAGAGAQCELEDRRGLLLLAQRALRKYHVQVVVRVHQAAAAGVAHGLRGLQPGDVLACLGGPRAAQNLPE